MNESNKTGKGLSSPAPRNEDDENVARQTMSSREIAELTGKRHPDVKRDIQSMLSELQEDVSSFAHIYLDSMRRGQTEYLLDREHTDCLLTGYRRNPDRVLHRHPGQLAQRDPGHRFGCIQLEADSLAAWRIA